MRNRAYHRRLIPRLSVLAVLVLNRDTIGCKYARPLGRQPEQIDHIQFRYAFRCRIDARAVHLFVCNPRLVVLHRIPFAAGDGRPPASPRR